MKEHLEELFYTLNKLVREKLTKEGLDRLALFGIDRVLAIYKALQESEQKEGKEEVEFER